MNLLFSRKKFKIQTHKRLKGMLFIRTRQDKTSKFLGHSPLSSYKTTLKQQLNGRFKTLGVILVSDLFRKKKKEKRKKSFPTIAVSFSTRPLCVMSCRHHRNGSSRVFMHVLSINTG